MALVRLQHAGHDLTTTGYTTLLTASTGLAPLGFILRKVTVVNVLSVTNTGNTLRHMEVNFSGDGGAPGSGNLIGTFALGAGAVATLGGPWWGTSNSVVSARLTDSGIGGGNMAVRLTAFHETTV